MKSRTTYLLYAVLAAAVGVWLYNSWSSDRRRIERQLDRFRSLIEKEGDESALAAADRARRVGELLARDFALHLEPYAPVLTDRRELARVVLGYRSRASRIGLDFRDRDLALDETLRIGDMTLVAAIAGTADGRRYSEGYRLRLRWVPEDGEWRIQRVDLLEVLERPGLF
jgi:hypothetical protein